CLSAFLLMLRRGRSSTRFPYTTLFRSLRFLRHFGMASSDFLDQHLDNEPLPPQRAIEVTDVVTIGSDHFVFVIPVAGLGIEKTVDRKSTRLNSSHSQISYAVFCLKKKN